MRLRESPAQYLHHSSIHLSPLQLFCPFSLAISGSSLPPMRECLVRLQQRMEALTGISS